MGDVVGDPLDAFQFQLRLWLESQRGVRRITEGHGKIEFDLSSMGGVSIHIVPDAKKELTHVRLELSGRGETYCWEGETITGAEFPDSARRMFDANELADSLKIWRTGDPRLKPWIELRR